MIILLGTKLKSGVGGRVVEVLVLLVEVEEVLVLVEEVEVVKL